MACAFGVCYVVLAVWICTTVCRSSPVGGFDPDENWWDLVGPKIFKNPNLSISQPPVAVPTSTVAPVTEAPNGVTEKSTNLSISKVSHSTTYPSENFNTTEDSMDDYGEDNSNDSPLKADTLEQNAMKNMEHGQKKDQEIGRQSCNPLPVEVTTQQKAERAKWIVEMITKATAIVFGVVGNEETAIVYKPKEEDSFPSCMELPNMTVLSVNHLNTCVRLFSSSTCDNETTSYYPGKIPLGEGEILKSARSIGKCFAKELDNATSKHVQHGLNFIMEFTKVETTAGSGDYAIPDTLIIE